MLIFYRSDSKCFPEQFSWNQRLPYIKQILCTKANFLWQSKPVCSLWFGMLNPLYDIQLMYGSTIHLLFLTFNTMLFLRIGSPDLLKFQNENLT